MHFEVLLEGASDVPTIKEIFLRRFGFTEGNGFRLHSHKGKGQLPDNPLAKPGLKHQGLLDQLPAKLRGYSNSLLPDSIVLVVIDLDNESKDVLINALNNMLQQLGVRLNVIFSFAIEETESWFIADLNAVKNAYPKAKLSELKKIPADAIVGAWEHLAKAINPKANLKTISGKDKCEWAGKIAPHLNLDTPYSPSLKDLIEGMRLQIENKA